MSECQTSQSMVVADMWRLHVALVDLRTVGYNQEAAHARNAAGLLAEAISILLADGHIAFTHALSQSNNYFSSSRGSSFFETSAASAGECRALCAGLAVVLRRTHSGDEGFHPVEHVADCIEHLPTELLRVGGSLLDDYRTPPIYETLVTAYLEELNSGSGSSKRPPK